MSGAPRAPDDAADRAALARSAAGDPRAFDALVERHAPALRRFARGLVGDSAADDAVQLALVDAYRGAPTYRGEGTVRGWLFVLTRHAALRATRRARPAAPIDGEAPLLGLGVAAGWGSDDPERAALRAERREAVTRALAALPEPDREVLLLRDVEQLDTEEAARALGVGARALKSRLHRARLRLAAALREGEGDGDG